MANEERLQKILSAAGIASRRKTEELILAGRITVNGQVVTTLGTRADPARDHIKVDGKLVHGFPARHYILLNKPVKVISSVSDPEGRRRVVDLVRAPTKVYPVGRLDYNTEGLILLTNDGEFARIVMSAGEHIPKVYQAKVKSALDEGALNRLRRGIRLGDGTLLAPVKIRPLRMSKNSWYEVTLTQGKNQQIRRMFELVGNPVMRLRRVAIGFLKQDGLPPGHHRRLTPAEVARVLKLGERMRTLRHK